MLIGLLNEEYICGGYCIFFKGFYIILKCKVESYIEIVIDVYVGYEVFKFVQFRNVIWEKECVFCKINVVVGRDCCGRVWYFGIESEVECIGDKKLVFIVKNVVSLCCFFFEKVRK